MDISYKELLKKYTELLSIVIRLQEDVNILKNQHKEIFYQRFLQKKLGASHKVTLYGTTDITTETQHIEIKKWKDYKHALGQLISYNHKDNKEIIAAFFGEYNNKEKIIKLFNEKNIIVWDLIINEETEIIIKEYNCIKENCQDDFTNWLNENILYEEGGILKLSDVCELYTGKNLYSKALSKYKIKIQDWIKTKYPNIDWEYQNTSIDNQRFRGWLHFKIKDTV